MIIGAYLLLFLIFEKNSKLEFYNPIVVDLMESMNVLMFVHFTISRNSNYHFYSPQLFLSSSILSTLINAATANVTMHNTITRMKKLR